MLLALLTLLPFLFFWRLITPNPADRMQIVAGDFTEQYFPLRAFVAQEWVSGHIPLWNPYLYGGQPALADIQSGALYPPHILQALILGWVDSLFGQEIGFSVAALQFQVIIHFSLAAVGTYLFARYLGLRNGVSWRRARFGGLIASLVFTYGGYLTGFPVQQLTILEVSAWLPWVLWGLSVANERISKWTNDETFRSSLHALRSTLFALRPVAWTALAFALAILAGHPQTVLYLFYLSLAYTIFQAFFLMPPYSPSPLLYRVLRLLPWLITVLVGTVIAAAQLLPTLEFISLSLRNDLSYQAVSAGLPLNEFISILYPGFFGGSPEYVGIVTLVLIAAALVLARPRRAVYFWAGAGLAGLLLAFGGHTFLYPLFYLFAPGFEAVRQQERVLLVYSFSAAVLAAYGALALTGLLPPALRPRYFRFERRLRQVALITFFLTGFFIYGLATATARGDEVNLFFGVLRHHLLGLLFLGGVLLLLQLRSRRWLRRWWGMGLLTLWLAFNLFTINWRFNLQKPPDSPPFTPNNIVRFLQNGLADPARIASGGLLPGGNSAASVYNLPDLTGNTPLQIAAVDAFFQQMPAWRMWQLMNVHYVVDQRDLGSDGLALVFEADELKVFEMLDPFPRAWLVGATEVIPDDSQAIARLASDDFDLRRQAIVAKTLSTPLAEVGNSEAQVIQLSSTQVTVTVEASGPHLLVLSQIYYPGWQAQLDSEPVKLQRVNVIQQGVIVPPGQHLIEVTFSPASFRWGAVLSGLGLLFWGGMLAWGKLLPPR